MDAMRLDRMTALQRLHVAKAAGQARELTRLSAKLGDADPRVVALAAKMDTHHLFVRQLSAEVERVGTPVLKPDGETWVLHGRVRDTTLAGVGNRRVALFDAKGARQVATAQTDESGYFAIEIGMTALQKMATTVASKRSAAAGPVSLALYAQVSSAGKSAPYEDGRVIVPSGGVANYMEIVLPGSAQSAAPKRGGRRGR
jgi:phosphatidate phosphatase APP1